MKRLILATVLFLGAFLMQGCCSIMCGDTQKVPVSTNPPGIMVGDETGQMIITPGVLVLKRSENHIITAMYPDGESQTVALKPSLNGWLWADFFWDFGIITGTVDLATGSAWTLKPKTIQFNRELPFFERLYLIK